MNIRFSHFRRVLVLVSVLTLSAFAAHATVVLSNLGTAATSTPSDPDPYKVTLATSWAVGFTVSGTESVSLNTIAISSSGDSSKFVVQIWSHNPSGPFGPVPGTLLSGSFTGPSSSAGEGGYSTYTFSAGGFVLDPSTTYWAVIKTIDTTPFFLANRGAYSGTGATFASIASGGNLTWFGTPSVTGNLSLELDATPVPEPAYAGAFAALFLIICGIGHTLRRHRLFSKVIALFR